MRLITYPFAFLSGFCLCSAMAKAGEGAPYQHAVLTMLVLLGAIAVVDGMMAWKGERN
jgi:hypothetical protein